MGALMCCFLPSSYALVLKDRPVLKYGTAWKTWTAVAKELNLKREDLWLQTKFSGLGAHSEDNIPYNKDAPLETRVRQSLALSLQNLQTDYIDSWIMHGPENNWDDHFEVWRTMEEAVDEGKNRFYSDSGHDVQVRTFCEEKDIEYQSFWTLVANCDAYRHPEALELTKKKGLSPDWSRRGECCYCCCFSLQALGISPMNGSKEDIALMNRFRSDEKIFEDSNEMGIIGNALGTSNWNTRR
ncbi:aldo-keto reductase family protein [Skeletonema marinoi]|uniref:Aldo-keto reductase family protein n=1 Tax=Skeletonema marinoi TaxID=267567 RepID=A0AAD8YE76_9STRA|nr:aldo-keto reductase family protein [Skeletonema marinoi]